MSAHGNLFCHSSALFFIFLYAAELITAIFLLGVRLLLPTPTAAKLFPRGLTDGEEVIPSRSLCFPLTTQSKVPLIGKSESMKDFKAEIV